MEIGLIPRNSWPGTWGQKMVVEIRTDISFPQRRETFYSFLFLSWFFGWFSTVEPGHKSFTQLLVQFFFLRRLRDCWDSLTAINSLVQYYPKLNVLCHYLYSFNILFFKLITASTADLFLEGMQRIHYTTFESMNNFIPLPKTLPSVEHTKLSLFI